MADVDDTKEAVYCVGLADVEAAQERIRGLAHVTPVLTSDTMDAISGRQLFFKCENMQKGARNTGQAPTWCC